MEVNFFAFSSVSFWWNKCTHPLTRYIWFTKAVVASPRECVMTLLSISMAATEFSMAWRSWVQWNKCAGLGVLSCTTGNGDRVGMPFSIRLDSVARADIKSSHDSGKRQSLSSMFANPMAHPCVFFPFVSVVSYSPTQQSFLLLQGIKASSCPGPVQYDGYLALYSIWHWPLVPSLSLQTLLSLFSQAEKVGNSHTPLSDHRCSCLCASTSIALACFTPVESFPMTSSSLCILRTLVAMIFDSVRLKLAACKCKSSLHARARGQYLNPFDMTPGQDNSLDTHRITPPILKHSP